MTSKCRLKQNKNLALSYFCWPNFHFYRNRLKKATSIRALKIQNFFFADYRNDFNATSSRQLKYLFKRNYESRMRYANFAIWLTNTQVICNMGTSNAAKCATWQTRALPLPNTHTHTNPTREKVSVCIWGNKQTAAAMITSAKTISWRSTDGLGHQQEAHLSNNDYDTNNKEPSTILPSSGGSTVRRFPWIWSSLSWVSSPVSLGSDIRSLSLRLS